MPVWDRGRLDDQHGAVPHPGTDRIRPRRQDPVDVIPYLAAASAIAAIALAYYFYRLVEKESPGDERMVF